VTVAASAIEPLPRQPRADARRNHLRVLAAAKGAFEAEGASVTVESIARRAGVGVGTVYRHFPTKEALFEAIIITSFQELVEEARRLADASEPGAAFYGYLERVFAVSEASKAIKDALGRSELELSTTANETFRALESAVGHLLVRAQDAGEARSDVSINELFALLGGACHASHTLRDGGVASSRMCAVICDGLRPPAPRA
jgi:AcrR family transcriptional regulator